MLLQIQKQNQASYHLLIEEVAHKHLPIKKVSFSKYVDGDEACMLLNIDTRVLLQYLVKSNDVHGIILDNGYIFVHPTGLIRKARNRYRRRLKKEIAIAEHAKREALYH